MTNIFSKWLGKEAKVTEEKGFSNAICLGKEAKATEEKGFSNAIAIPEENLFLFMLTKEFIMENECYGLTLLTDKERKKLEDKGKFPRRLLIKAPNKKLPIIFGHCYLGKEIRQWFDDKQKKRVRKPKN